MCDYEAKEIIVNAEEYYNLKHELFEAKRKIKKIEQIVKENLLPAQNEMLELIEDHIKN